MPEILFAVVALLVLVAVGGFLNNSQEVVIRRHLELRERISTGLRASAKEEEEEFAAALGEVGFCPSCGMPIRVEELL